MMNESSESLARLELVLQQTAPSISNRLQPGMSEAEIAQQIASFAWHLPDDAYTLYRWHDGLSGNPGKLNLVEKFIRLKGKWHGELAGRENEICIQIDRELAVVKFLPLAYALAGHRHLKLGRCPIDLLPMAIFSNRDRTLYCMMRLDPDLPIVYCADGTNLPPIHITEAFLSTQPQFPRLKDLLTLLIHRCERSMPASSTESIDLLWDDMNL